MFEYETDDIILIFNSEGMIDQAYRITEIDEEDDVVVLTNIETSLSSTIDEFAIPRKFFDTIGEMMAVPIYTKR